MRSDLPDPLLPTAAGARPSKTQRKKAMIALQALGTRLTGLNAAQLAQVPLPEGLRAAIVAARAITAHEARRRQLQYVGKLMRQTDPEPIERALEHLAGDSRAAVDLVRRCERWRERLLADDTALGELLREHPGADLQALRSLIRAARREQDGGLLPRHSRALFRWLRERFGAAAHSED